MLASAFRQAILLVALALPLAGCGGSMCLDFSDLEVASDYSPYRPEMKYGEWVEHEILNNFLRGVVRSGGVAALQTTHGFRCTSRSPETCGDCHTCTRTIPQRGNRLFLLRSYCSNEGDMEVRTEIGPGTAIRTMSYYAPRRP